MSNPDLDVNLYISTQCPHCAQALELLTKAVKQGNISSLNITNLNKVSTPENYAHIRSVPFIQIQNFDFTGSITSAEIKEWEVAQKEGAFAKYYFSTLLNNGKISNTELFVKRNPDYLLVLVELAQNEQTKMQVRIGINAIFESLDAELLNESLSNKIINSLIEASKTKNHAIRVDLIYLSSLMYLAVKENKSNETLKIFLQSLINDDSEEIQEIINDVL